MSLHATSANPSGLSEYSVQMPDLSSRQLPPLGALAEVTSVVLAPSFPDGFPQATTARRERDERERMVRRETFMTGSVVKLAVVGESRRCTASAPRVFLGKWKIREGVARRPSAAAMPRMKHRYLRPFLSLESEGCPRADPASRAC